MFSSELDFCVALWALGSMILWTGGSRPMAVHVSPSGLVTPPEEEKGKGTEDNRLLNSSIGCSPTKTDCPDTIERFFESRKLDPAWAANRVPVLTSSHRLRTEDHGQVGR